MTAFYLTPSHADVFAETRDDTWMPSTGQETFTREFASLQDNIDVHSM